jgi:hypothetical protein
MTGFSGPAAGGCKKQYIFSDHPPHAEFVLQNRNLEQPLENRANVFPGHELHDEGFRPVIDFLEKTDLFHVPSHWEPASHVDWHRIRCQ